MQALSSQIIAQILTNEMSLPEGTIWLRDQNKVIPNDLGLYIIVGIVSSIPYSNSTYMKQEGSSPNFTQNQVTTVLVKESVQVDILSRTTAAMLQNWQIVAAMQSFFAQQMMEKYNFKIARIPQSFLNTSYAEGGSFLNRYSVTIPCLVWYRKDNVISSPLGDYFDSFETELNDAQTIDTDTPIAEFTINESFEPPFSQG